MTLDYIIKIYLLKLKKIDIDNYNKIEERIFKQYLVEFQNMTKKSYVPYSKYLKKFNLRNPLEKEQKEQEKESNKLSMNDIILKSRNIKTKDLMKGV